MHSVAAPLACALGMPVAFSHLSHGNDSSLQTLPNVPWSKVTLVKNPSVRSPLEFEQTGPEGSVSLFCRLGALCRTLLFTFVLALSSQELFQVVPSLGLLALNRVDPENPI